MKEIIRTIDSVYVDSVAFSRNGGILASGGDDGEVKLWRVQKIVDGSLDPLMRTMEGHSKSVSSVVFSPLGGYLASASWDKTVKLWHIKTGNCTKTLEGHDGAVNSVAFSPRGVYLASGSADKTIKLWNDSGECIRTLYTPERYTSDVRCVTFSPDGRYLASGGDDGEVKLWNLANKSDEALKILGVNMYDEGITSVAFSPDGQYLASGSEQIHDAHDWDRVDEGFGGRAKLWRVSGKKWKMESDDTTYREVMQKLPEMTMKHGGNINEGVFNVAFSINGNYLFITYGSTIYCHNVMVNTAGGLETQGTKSHLTLIF